MCRNGGVGRSIKKLPNNAVRKMTLLRTGLRGPIKSPKHSSWLPRKGRRRDIQAERVFGESPSPRGAEQRLLGDAAILRWEEHTSNAKMENRSDGFGKPEAKKLKSNDN